VQHGSNASSHLAIEDLGANVRIFREIAGRAVQQGQCSWSELHKPLTRYEAMTLDHLFGTMIGTTARGPLDLARYLWVALSINPALLRDERFLKSCRVHARALIRPKLEHGNLGRLILYGLWLLRATYRRLNGKPLIKVLTR
jgi:hypothetical protein